MRDGSGLNGLQIDTLTSGHPHFATLYEACDTLNHAIAKAENGGAAMTDEALEIDKKKRLKRKDDITQMLHQA